MRPVDPTLTGPTWWPFLPALRNFRATSGVLVGWLIIGLLSVALAVLEAKLGWSGMVIRAWGYEVPITIYPPLLLSLLLTLWLGPAWGGGVAWISTFVSGLVGQMPIGLAALFAFATPLELLIVWGSLTILGVPADLRGQGAVLKFLGVATIAAIASSLAALLYIDSQSLDLVSGQRIWQGWIIGDILQMALAVPILRLAGAQVRTWVDRQFPDPPRHVVSYTRSVVLVMVVVLMLFALVAIGASQMITSLQIPETARTATGEPLLPRLRELGLFLGLLVAATFGTTMVFTATLARVSERERLVSRRDPLTGALNRRSFREEYQREADRSRRLGLGIAVVVIDLDHLKSINDRHGHDTGDEVLRQFTRRVSSVIRDHDLLFRWGGDEFVLLLPHTSGEEAPAMAERVRAAIAAEPMVTHTVADPVRLTVSCGVACTLEIPHEPDALVALADAALYRAKHDGRGRVFVA
jgi:diguanylate cyclase (GGDEF)-like protein